MITLQDGKKVGFPHGGLNSFFVVPNRGNRVHINDVLEGLAQWAPERGFPPELRKCIVLGLPDVVEAADLTTNPGISRDSRNFLDDILTPDELRNFLAELNINLETNLVQEEGAEEEGEEEEGQEEEDDDARRARLEAEAAEEERQRRLRLLGQLRAWLKLRRDELAGNTKPSKVTSAKTSIKNSYTPQEIQNAIGILKQENPANWKWVPKMTKRRPEDIVFRGGRRRLYKTKKNTLKSKRKKRHRKQRKTRRA